MCLAEPETCLFGWQQQVQPSWRGTMEVTEFRIYCERLRLSHHSILLPPYRSTSTLCITFNKVWKMNLLIFYHVFSSSIWSRYSVSMSSECIFHEFFKSVTRIDVHIQQQQQTLWFKSIESNVQWSQAHSIIGKIWCFMNYGQISIHLLAHYGFTINMRLTDLSNEFQAMYKEPHDDSSVFLVQFICSLLWLLWVVKPTRMYEISNFLWNYKKRSLLSLHLMGILLVERQSLIAHNSSKSWVRIYQFRNSVCWSANWINNAREMAGNWKSCLGRIIDIISGATVQSTMDRIPIAY